MSLRMKAEDSLFMVIDIQEKLSHAIFTGEEVVANAAKLLEAAQKLDVPCLVTEQYPAGIGHTVDKLLVHVRKEDVFEKMTFSCLQTPVIQEEINERSLKQIVVVGMECHVCVLQTVLDLIEAGFDVFVVADGVGSRTTENKTLGLERMRQAGARIVSTEMVIFEWLERAGTENFKQMLPLIK